MLVKIVFGGCILLAAVWLLISLAIRRRGNYPIAAFVLDVVITLLVLVMFGFSTVGFVREQNRQRRWQDAEQETEIFRPEESWIDETKTDEKVNVSETTQTQIPISTPSNSGKGAVVEISSPTTEESQNN